MKSFLLLTTLLVPAHLAVAWSAKYAVDCPERCDSRECRSSLRCKRTVLDDCGCCRVCAAGLGETCYRTVSGMDGVKCGPGLRCQFYSEEDDFGDEFGICKGKERPLASPPGTRRGGVLIEGFYQSALGWEGKGKLQVRSCLAGVAGGRRRSSCTSFCVLQQPVWQPARHRQRRQPTL